MPTTTTRLLARAINHNSEQTIAKPRMKLLTQTTRALRLSPEGTGGVPRRGDKPDTCKARMSAPKRMLIVSIWCSTPKAP